MNSTSTLAILEAVGNALRFLGDEILAIAGDAAEDAPEPEPEVAATPAKPTRKRSPKKAAPEPEDDEDQDDDDDDQDDEEEEPSPKPKGKAKPAAKGKAKPITLEQLQELAAQLLEAGQRKKLKAILTEAGAKTLSTADEEDYPEILEAQLEIESGETRLEAVAELED